MSELSSNYSHAFVEAKQYSQFILDNLHDVLLPEGMWRDVSDFGSGQTLNIKTVGTVTLQDAAEDVPLVFNPIDKGSITLSITDYVGDAWRVTDELREDGSQIDTLMSMRAMESTRAFGEQHETKFLAACDFSATATDVYTVNGRPHRWVAGDTVDSWAYNPQCEGLMTTGFASSHRFVRNIMGFDVYTSNFLNTKTSSEALNASSYGLPTDTAEIGDVANIFMCVADDGCKPIMHAWRRMPKTEGWRDEETRSDKFQVTSRFGFGVQRKDTLGVVYTDPSKY